MKESTRIFLFLFLGISFVLIVSVLLLGVGVKDIAESLDNVVEAGDYYYCNEEDEPLKVQVKDNLTILEAKSLNDLSICVEMITNAPAWVQVVWRKENANFNFLSDVVEISESGLYRFTLKESLIKVSEQTHFFMVHKRNTIFSADFIVE